MCKFLTKYRSSNQTAPLTLHTHTYTYMGSRVVLQQLCDLETNPSKKGGVCLSRAGRAKVRSVHFLRARVNNCAQLYVYVIGVGVLCMWWSKMSTLGVVHYNSSPHKVNNVLQQTSNNLERREVIVLRKQLPEKDTKHDILITNTARKRPKSGKEATKVHNPPPMAVARRNARERNRVKQVNNGFATLRQHIPNSIAAAFESSNGRGGNKKLSKVETLRMAVEYIRSLEDLLAMDDHSENVSTSTSNNYPYAITSPSLDEDDLSTNPTPPPQQYLRINTNNSYQLIPAHLYEDSENLEPLDEHILSDPSLIDADFSEVHDLLHASDSLSPGIYSDSSLSPGTVKSEPQTSYMNVFNEQLTPPMEDVKSEVKQEHPPILSLQNENELPQEHKDNMMQVMAWWEQQQQQQQASRS